MFKVFLHYHW